MVESSTPAPFETDHPEAAAALYQIYAEPRRFTYYHPWKRQMVPCFFPNPINLPHPQMSRNDLCYCGSNVKWKRCGMTGKHIKWPRSSLHDDQRHRR